MSATVGETEKLLKIAQEVSRLLEVRDEKVVFAESCTAGLVSASLGQIPGISARLCGSAVTYQPKLKRSWIGVKKEMIKRHTAESQHVANAMALGVLKITPSADWSVAIVGHLGPNAPEQKDGQIFISCARRTRKGNFKVKAMQEYFCKSPDRLRRQGEAVDATLTCFARHLHARVEHDSKGKMDGVPNTEAKPTKKDKKS